MAEALSAIPHRPLGAHEATNPDAALDLVVVVEPDGDPSADGLGRLFAQHRPALLELLRGHGGVLFRGFDVAQHDFERIVSQGFQADRYLWMFPMPGRWARRLLGLPGAGWVADQVLGRLETLTTGREIVGEAISTVAHEQTFQFPHHEYGAFFNVPAVLAFYCEREAEREGETLLCDARASYEAMDPAVRATFESTRHVVYRSKSQRYLPPFTAPALLHHPRDGYPTVNFTAYQHGVFAEVARARLPGSTIGLEELDETYGFEPTFVQADGAHRALNEDQVAAIARAHLTRSVLLPWRRGDLLLLDNIRVVHGRLNAGFPEQKLLHVMLCDHVRNQNRFVWWPRPSVGERAGAPGSG